MKVIKVQKEKKVLKIPVAICLQWELGKFFLSTRGTCERLGNVPFHNSSYGYVF